MVLSSPLLVGAFALFYGSSARAATYNLLELHQGQDFFNGFVWRGTYDFPNNQPDYDAPDNALNWWANETYSFETGLTKILDNGDAIIRVDNVTDGATFTPRYPLRYSVRLDSETYYGTGNVVIADLVHVPFGCSVWPAFWMSGNDGTFPQGGEIDIYENVNAKNANQVNIHGESTCKLPDTRVNAGPHDNCGDAATANLGCSFANGQNITGGDAFNSAGGGMWVTEFAADAINIWFFSRPDVPSALATAANATSIDTSSLGATFATVPAAADNCNFKEMFSPMKIVISIALCGNFAGAQGVFPATCALAPGLNASQTCYQDWVAGPGSNFDDAYWEFASLRVFNDGSPSSYGTDNQTVVIAAPGAGGPVAGEPASAPGGTATTSAVTSSTSAASGGSGGGSAGGAGSGKGGAAPRQAAAGMFGALLLAAAGVMLVL